MKLDGHPAPHVSRFHSSGHAPGFTLIELLTVIAIIAVLAALAFPFISKMQNSGSQSKAAANFRQLGAALTMYAADNNQSLPRLQTSHRWVYRNNTANQIGRELWSQLGLPAPINDVWQPVTVLMSPALKKWLLKYSPTDPNGGAHAAVWKVTLEDGSRYPFGSGNGTGVNAPMKMHAVPNPSKTWAIYERGGTGDPYTLLTFPEPIHGSTRAVLFFDGHVEVIPSDAPKPIY
jgi:prepilin-type N-terminal cleavage/methylation domain-containing protein/prepilin-type processing-associated H-X9-DG protein